MNTSNITPAKLLTRLIRKYSVKTTLTRMAAIFVPPIILCLILFVTIMTFAPHVPTHENVVGSIFLSTMVWLLVVVNIIENDTSFSRMIQDLGILSEKEVGLLGFLLPEEELVLLRTAVKHRSLRHKKGLHYTDLFQVHDIYLRAERNKNATKEHERTAGLLTKKPSVSNG